VGEHKNRKKMAKKRNKNEVSRGEPTMPVPPKKKNPPVTFIQNVVKFEKKSSGRQKKETRRRVGSRRTPEATHRKYGALA